MPSLPRLCAAIAAIGLVASATPSLAQAPADICRKDPKFREQDFTLGTWDVYAGAAKTAEVTMALILNDCVIEERWKVAAGQPAGNGIGVFNYAPLIKAWAYHWATDAGSSTSFRGSLVAPGQMRYTTEKPLPDGRVRLRQWTLSAMPDGTIRELSVGSEDQGQTWATEYDLRWVRHR